MRSYYQRISKHRAFSLFAAGETVWLCPSRISPESEWSVVAPVYLSESLRQRAQSYEPQSLPTEQVRLWCGTVEHTAWQLMLNEWAYYNTNAEMGQYAHYYLKKATL